MLEKFSLDDFNQIYEIMQDSFPVDERRPYEEQKALFSLSTYQIYGKRGKGETQAFIAAYSLKDLLFIEHFAVKKTMRGQGLGGEILQELLKTTSKRVCLEVELPQTPIACRRIAFYERNGFVYNEYSYAQPPLSEGQNSVPLRIMSAPAGLSATQFNEVKQRLYAEVYLRK